MKERLSTNTKVDACKKLIKGDSERCCNCSGTLSFYDMKISRSDTIRYYITSDTALYMLTLDRPSCSYDDLGVK